MGVSTWRTQWKWEFHLLLWSFSWSIQCTHILVETFYPAFCQRFDLWMYFWKPVRSNCWYPVIVLPKLEYRVCLLKSFHKSLHVFIDNMAVICLTGNFNMCETDWKLAECESKTLTSKSGILCRECINYFPFLDSLWEVRPEMKNASRCDEGMNMQQLVTDIWFLDPTKCIF